MDEVDGMEEDDAPWVEGIFDGAFGALGDEIWGGGDGVLVSSWVRSMKGCFGGMMTSLCFLGVLEMEDFGDNMVVLDGEGWWNEKWLYGGNF